MPYWYLLMYYLVYQLGIEKLLLIETSIVVMSWDLLLEFSVAIFVSMLTERFGGVMLD